MKIAHFSNWAPFRSGLFEYVIDMIKHERKLGIDSQLIIDSAKNPDPKRHTHEGITAEPWKNCMDSDVWVLHYMIPSELVAPLYKKKRIAVLHGTSEIMALHAIESHGKDNKFDMHVGFMKTYNKVVTITKYDTQIMKNYDYKSITGKKDGSTIIYINDAIDLDKYNLDGYAYPFRYRPSIISTANVRINKNIFPLLWAFPKIRQEISSARLNIAGLNFLHTKVWLEPILKDIHTSSSIECIHNTTNDIRPYLRGADISFNSNYNGIFSRDSMEALAMGTSVIAATPEHTKYAYHRHTDSIVKTIKHAWEDLMADPQGTVEKNLEYAEKHFCMEKAVKKFVDIYNSL